MKQFQRMRITGRVQGVFFRQSTREKAVELGITGFARNEEDGSVYIEAEGDPEQLQAFTNWCRKGPPLANVLEVIIETGQPQNYSCFEVRR